ncbi:MAG: phosphoribosylanthranilate isomerase, partial [Pseudomonadales bacterium]|nr:phosphoribosylanthranilate isomerase [Pseudomonadales bacterium]
VDAIGLVFYKKSPRYVSPEVAASIIAQLPPFVTTVGLFVNERADAIKDILDIVPLDLLQFHGSEIASECSCSGRPYIKAIAMKPGLEVANVVNQYPDAQGILLDTYDVVLPGGTGKAFDWSKVPQNLSKPIILAGGLTPENIRQAVDVVNPWAVDVSGGVEESKGKKDHRLIQAFIEGVHRV